VASFDSTDGALPDVDEFSSIISTSLFSSSFLYASLFTPPLQGFLCLRDLISHMDKFVVLCLFLFDDLLRRFPENRRSRSFYCKALGETSTFFLSFFQSIDFRRNIQDPFRGTYISREISLLRLQTRRVFRCIPVSSRSTLARTLICPAFCLRHPLQPVSLFNQCGKFHGRGNIQFAPNVSYPCTASEYGLSLLLPASLRSDFGTRQA
jgi:hypothetical protein